MQRSDRKRKPNLQNLAKTANKLHKSNISMKQNINTQNDLVSISASSRVSQVSSYQRVPSTEPVSITVHPDNENLPTQNIEISSAPIKSQGRIYSRDPDCIYFVDPSYFDIPSNLRNEGEYYDQQTIHIKMRSFSFHQESTRPLPKNQESPLCVEYLNEPTPPPPEQEFDFQTRYEQIKKQFTFGFILTTEQKQLYRLENLERQFDKIREELRPMLSVDQMFALEDLFLDFRDQYKEYNPEKKYVHSSITGNMRVCVGNQGIKPKEVYGKVDVRKKKLVWKGEMTKQLGKKKA